MFTYGFYNSIGGDRRYDAEQFTSIFDGVIVDGVFQTVGEFLATVKNGGMQVLVKSGRAWFNHTWNLNDAPLPLTLDPSDVLRTRIDAIVLEVDSSIESRENSIKVVKGIPSTNPVKPTLKNEGGVYQHALSYITILPNAAEIKDENIEIVVGLSETPFVTSPLTTVPIDDLFNRWNGEFNAWFENLKEQLSDDVVANLQKQIDEKVDLSDKATAEDIQNGTPGKWVDAESYHKESIGTHVGDFVSSLRNLELEDDSFIACDQRVLLRDAYEELCEHPSINVRLPEFRGLYRNNTLVSTNLNGYMTMFINGPLYYDGYIYGYAVSSNNVIIKKMPIDEMSLGVGIDVVTIANISTDSTKMIAWNEYILAIPLIHNITNYYVYDLKNDSLEYRSYKSIINNDIPLSIKHSSFNWYIIDEKMVAMTEALHNNLISGFCVKIFDAALSTTTSAVIEITEDITSNLLSAETIWTPPNSNIQIHLPGPSDSNGNAYAVLYHSLPSNAMTNYIVSLNILRCNIRNLTMDLLTTISNTDVNEKYPDAATGVGNVYPTFTETNYNIVFAAHDILHIMCRTFKGHGTTVYPGAPCHITIDLTKETPNIDMIIYKYDLRKNNTYTTPFPYMINSSLSYCTISDDYFIYGSISEFDTSIPAACFVPLNKELSDDNLISIPILSASYSYNGDIRGSANSLIPIRHGYSGSGNIPTYFEEQHYYYTGSSNTSDPNASGTNLTVIDLNDISKRCNVRMPGLTSIGSFRYVKECNMFFAEAGFYNIVSVLRNDRRIAPKKDDTYLKVSP